MKTLFLSLALICALQLSATDKQTCKGIKADKTQCMSVITGKDGYCQHHSPNAIKCSHTKGNGERCKMPVKSAGQKCHHHNK